MRGDGARGRAESAGAEGERAAILGPMTARSGPGVRKRLLAVGLSLGCLLSLELALRLCGQGPRAERFLFQSAFPAKAADSLLVTHPARVFTLAARQRMAPRHAGRYANETWPFRGRPPRPAPPGLARVLFLGDSCIFGTGVDTSETLPHQVALALARHGLSQDEVQVVNLGVPGYSIVQVRELLMEELAQGPPPAAVVLYVGAWNDQAPAVDRSDLELVRRRSGWRGLARRSALLSLLARLGPSAEARPGDAAVPPRPRVEEEDLAELLRDVLLSSRAAGAWPLLVAPAHPASTAREFPRTRRDAATCLRVAAENGVESLDAEAILAASGVPEESRFLDVVHLSPPALAALAEPVASALAARLAGRTRASPVRATDASERLEFTPAEACTFGDVPVRIRPLGFELSPPFVLLVGGAPVLDLAPTADGEWSGILPANGPGRHEVLLQRAESCRVFPDAVLFRLPELALEGKRLELRSRPGDRAVVGGSSRLQSPHYTPQGALEVDPGAAWQRTFSLVCDGTGRSELDLAPFLADLREPAFFQALFQPQGLSDEAHLGRWSNVLRLDLGGR